MSTLFYSEILSEQFLSVEMLPITTLFTNEKNCLKVELFPIIQAIRSIPC